MNLLTVVCTSGYGPGRAGAAGPGSSSAGLQSVGSAAVGPGCSLGLFGDHIAEGGHVRPVDLGDGAHVVVGYVPRAYKTDFYGHTVLLPAEMVRS